MANPESIEDILLAGISKEIESNVFYNLLSQYVENPQIRALCGDFASEELEHKAKLELELMKLGHVVTRNLTQNKSLPKPLDFMVDMTKIMQMDYRDLLLLAIRKEKASFKFYIELIPAVAEQSLRNVLMELAEEEARHKISFELEYDMLTANKNPPPEQQTTTD
jgi:rubrerythrin